MIASLLTQSSRAIVHANHLEYRPLKIEASISIKLLSWVLIHIVLVRQYFGAIPCAHAQDHPERR